MCWYIHSIQESQDAWEDDMQLNPCLYSWDKVFMVYTGYSCLHSASGPPASDQAHTSLSVCDLRLTGDLSKLYPASRPKSAETGSSTPVPPVRINAREDKWMGSLYQHDFIMPCVHVMLSDCLFFVSALSWGNKAFSLAVPSAWKSLQNVLKLSDIISLSHETTGEFVFISCSSY